MERLPDRRRTAIVKAALFAVALAGCSSDGYSTDPSNVQCDGRRTMVDLEAGDTATFLVHGSQEGDVATVKVRRGEDDASVAVTGDVTGPPQQVGPDGFTPPIRIVEGAELSTFGAGGAWVIDVREDSVVIQGTCAGM